MTRWLDDREQRVWRSWLQASSRLEAHLARRMQADGDISMSDFEVLVPLSEAPRAAAARLRARPRAAVGEEPAVPPPHAAWSAAGWSRGEDCGTDRRGAFVVLTDRGPRCPRGGGRRPTSRPCGRRSSTG